MEKFRSEASELAAGLDLVLFSLESGGIPYALFESMAASVSTVAHAVGRLLEVLSNEVSALVLPDCFVEPWAAALLRFGRSCSENKALSRVNRGSEKRFLRQPNVGSTQTLF